jgi:hypothetical protein
MRDGKIFPRKWIFFQERFEVGARLMVKPPSILPKHLFLLGFGGRGWRNTHAFPINQGVRQCRRAIR